MCYSLSHKDRPWKHQGTPEYSISYYAVLWKKLIWDQDLLRLPSLVALAELAITITFEYGLEICVLGLG